MVVSGGIDLLQAEMGEKIDCRQDLHPEDEQKSDRDFHALESEINTIWLIASCFVFLIFYLFVPLRR